MLACRPRPDNTGALQAERLLLQLHAEHSDFLQRMARLLCGSSTLADDLVQETWLRAWRSLAGLRNHKAARSWLMTILRRELARHFAREDNNHLKLSAIELEPHCTQAADNQIELEQIFRQLSRQDRWLLQAHLLDGLSYRELAAATNLSTSTIGVRLHRLRKRLNASETMT